MTRKTLMAFTAMMLFLPTDAGMAQENPVQNISCRSVYEEIVPLRTPNFDQAALWKKTVGVQGIDRPRALMRVADDGVISVGESISYVEKEGLKFPRLQMIRIDKKGKILVDQLIDVADLHDVVGGVLKKTRVIVLSHLKKGHEDYMSLTYLDGAGQKKSENIIRDTQRNLVPKDFAPLAKGGFVILAQATNRRKNSEPYTALVWVNNSGKILTVKEYMPGIKTQPSSLSLSSDSVVLVSGRIESEKSNNAGWLLQVLSEGDLVFQRPYSRGSESTLRQAIQLQDRSVLAIGETLPAGEGDKAAWVIKVDANGNPVWQKYLTGKYSYTGIDVHQLPDGRIMTVWAAMPTSFGGRRFARVISFSVDGQILSDESFLEGSNAIPFQMIVQKDRRMLLGMAETGFATDQKDDQLQYITYDTWIMALPPLPNFDNPCADAPDRTLDDLP